ncbi:glutathione peroxidase [Paenibacillus sp. UNC496MF]|uniref:glutathione peroxidase n=1 Tax=Paenibacillus sp. UNC496MF TaxID=1502753 RepID=UPI0008E4D4DC|nr:glutathione peroxidase [Paenibacillus sp. UNC496MF]SFJ80688.1 glutathione peroxidase [Paenibacillus sp. UNC496MF]
MSIYEYEVPGMDGEPIAMSAYRGKVLLIVNTASRCGYARQFAGLQRLYDAYRGQGFELLGIPCNQFNAKEPEDGEAIRVYCEGAFGATFPLAAKADAVGEAAHPLFVYLTGQAPFQGFDTTAENGRRMRDFLRTKHPGLYAGDGIKWNFTKFLIGRAGEVAGRFETPEEPETLAPAVESLLARRRDMFDADGETGK